MRERDLAGLVSPFLKGAYPIIGRQGLRGFYPNAVTASLVKILKTQGLMLFLSGATITVITLLVSLLIMIFMFKMNLPSIMGALSALMTNPPALDAANAKSKTELVNLSYASIYPLALIFKIVAAQLILILF